MLIYYARRDCYSIKPHKLSKYECLKPIKIGDLPPFCHRSIPKKQKKEKAR